MQKHLAQKLTKAEANGLIRLLQLDTETITQLRDRFQYELDSREIPKSVEEFYSPMEVQNGNSQNH